MSDALLFHTENGGEISFVNGQAVMDDGLRAAAYLSLFGGNERDSGIQADDPMEWWGNKSETEDARKYRSDTQHILRSLPATTGNLKRLEDAAQRDLTWMVESGLATAVVATVSIPTLNRVKLEVRIEVFDEAFDFVFTESWRTQLANQ